MKNAIIIHGSYGNPNENWYSWLKKELSKKDLKVFLPEFPTPLNQSFETWEAVIKDILPNIDKNTLIIAHSVGVPFILKVVEKHDLKISNLFLVSGFINKLDDSRFDKINSSFLGNVNWEIINRSSPQTFVYASDNDPYVNKDHAMYLCKKIPGSRLTVIKQAGHFNTESGYAEFPQLYEDISSLL